MSEAASEPSAEIFLVRLWDKTSNGTNPRAWTDG